MALVAHFDLELHQMDAKIVFLNGDIDETIYMMQPENFVSNESNSMASHQWYHKFHQVITPYGFEANVVDDCVYHKFSGSKYIFLVLYVDDILLASSDTCLLHETKRFLTKNFEMKDLGEASFVLGIQILRDRSQGILRLSQENYINKVLKRFDMKDSKPGDTLIAKGDKFSLKQCPNNDLERNEMQKIPYALAVGSLTYAQVCTHPDMVEVLGRYLSYPGMQHWKAIKRVMRYLRRTKGHMLTYRKFEDLEIIEYSDFDFAGCQDSKRSTSGYIYMLAGGAISWKSVKQTLIAPSTMAVEFVACLEASNQGIWFLRVVDGIERPLKIYCDNNSAVLYSNNNRSSTKSKFIDIKFLVVKERVQNKQISIEHIRTSFMLADPLTKALIPKKHKRGSRWKNNFRKHIKEMKDKTHMVRYEYKKSGHFKFECPNLEKEEEKEKKKQFIKKKKSLTTSWEDLDMSSSKDEDEELMTNTTSKDEDDEEKIFKTDPKILNPWKKENSILKKENERLKEQTNDLSKVNIYEVIELQKEVIELRQSLAKFVNGTQNLNKLLKYNRSPYDKSDLGF
ncbi:hypothetical protein CR513_15882, partial [Mucuna pruriens]